MSQQVLTRFFSLGKKTYKSAAILNRSYFKSESEMARVVKLLESLHTLEGPSVEFLAENKWDYSQKGNDWSRICPFGPVQSPIRINSEDVHKSSECFSEKYYPLSLEYSQITTRGRFTKRIYIVHGDYGKMLVYPPFKSPPRVFNSVQFHFHAPSEHVIDNEDYELEMHLVHRDSEKGTINAVLGFLFKNNGKSNPFIQQAIDSLERPVEIDLGLLLQKEPQFYLYHGSLTTPPCSENILWFLTSKVCDIDSQQLKFFTSRWHENLGFADGNGNNREVQPLYNRAILHFDAEGGCKH